jgi:hypothetical protein
MFLKISTIAFTLTVFKTDENQQTEVWSLQHHNAALPQQAPKHFSVLLLCTGLRHTFLQLHNWAKAPKIPTTKKMKPKNNNNNNKSKFNLV